MTINGKFQLPPLPAINYLNNQFVNVARNYVYY